MQRLMMSSFVAVLLSLMLFGAMAAQADKPEGQLPQETDVLHRYLRWKMELGQLVMWEKVVTRYVTTETMNSAITRTVSGIAYYHSPIGGDPLKFPVQHTLTPRPLESLYWNDLGFEGIDYNFSPNEILSMRYELGCRPGPTFDLRILQSSVEDTILILVDNTTEHPLRVILPDLTVDLVAGEARLFDRQYFNGAIVMQTERSSEFLECAKVEWNFLKPRVHIPQIVSQ